VAANTQIGKTNSQTVGQSEVNEQKIVRPKARRVVQDNSNTTNQQIPGWVWVVAIVTWIVGWVTDTPATMIRQVFKKK